MTREVNGVLVAAHELKAPLSLMRQLALSLQELQHPADSQSSRIHETSDQLHNNQQDAQSARICAQMVNVSERALLHVNDLTKIARLEDGLFVMEPVSVRGVCEAVARDITPLFGYTRKKLQLKYSNHQKLAIANGELLYSVVYNFCVNAMRYSDDETSSTLSISDAKSRIRIAVRDYGPALPANIWRELNHGKLDQPTNISMRAGSSGLGLYISSRFAEYMHAQLGAVRHRDGTSFYVDLPISQQACLF